MLSERLGCCQEAAPTSLILPLLTLRSAGPLKKVSRVVEKLCLDPGQRAALDACDPDQLDASGVLDTVRGMIRCDSMAHAHLVLRRFVERFGKGTDASASGVRSKNRYAVPSGGGWMDVPLPGLEPRSWLAL